MRLAIFLFLLCSVSAVQGQNLVPNGGFENHRACPGDYTQDPAEFYVDSWSSPNIGTPDYFNVCSHGEADVPHNWAGVSDPYEGVGYAGLYMWFATSKNYREYLQAELSESLVKDTLYYLEFHYKLSSYSKYSIDRIGLLLTDSLVRLKNDRPFKVRPTFQLSKIPPSRWRQDYGRKQRCFTRLGAEKNLCSLEIFLMTTPHTTTRSNSGQ